MDGGVTGALGGSHPAAAGAVVTGTAPIASSLTAGGARQRVEEWRAFLARAVVAAERADGGRELRLLLRDSGDDLLAAVDLARREHECCRFFEFALRLEAEACRLVVRVPEGEGVAALDGLASLLPPLPPGRE